MSEVFDRLKAALADRCAVERELGSGGMAVVYLAEDLRHERRVAIKVLRPELASVAASAPNSGVSASTKSPLDSPFRYSQGSSVGRACPACTLTCDLAKRTSLGGGRLITC